MKDENKQHVEKKLINTITIADALDIDVKTFRPILAELIAEEKIKPIRLGKRIRFRPAVIDLIIDVLEAKPLNGK